MRTTLTLDDDVAARLERLRKERDDSLKAVVNDVMRHGLAALDRGAGTTTEYRLAPRSLGRPRFAVDSVADAIAVGEGEEHR